MADTGVKVGMKKGTDQLNSTAQAQRFLTLHGLTQNLFRLGRHLMQAVNYRLLRTQAFQVWQEAVCA
jgi:putative transposase